MENPTDSRRPQIAGFICGRLESAGDLLAGRLGGLRGAGGRAISARKMLESRYLDSYKAGGQRFAFVGLLAFSIAVARASMVWGLASRAGLRARRAFHWHPPMVR